MNQHLQKIDHRSNEGKIEHVDFIYLINLDERPEKLKLAYNKLAAFGIRPQRMPAIYGWNLKEDILFDVCLKFLPGMDSGADKKLKACLSPTLRHQITLDESCYGKPCFYPRMSLGAIGCALSHLSILQDAYDAGFETIWVLEDDFSISVDPHQLAGLIESLDHLDPDWDILYTDNRSYFEPFTPGTVWRPDMPSIDYEPLYKHIPIGDFFAIGGRCQAHSLLIRRKAIKKILDFEQSKGIFLPYDIELAFIPDMRSYNTNCDFIWGGELSNTSDTDYYHFRASSHV